jgi:hypothetical protein
MELQQDDSVVIRGYDKLNQKIILEGSWGEKSETILVKNEKLFQLIAQKTQ